MWKAQNQIHKKADAIEWFLLLAIISADHFSRSYEKSKHPEEQFEDSAAKARAEQRSRQSNYERFMTFGKENRYKIVGASWVASMAAALTIVGRSPYLITTQKLVQARVYAQGLTLAVLVATAIFEIGDRNKDEGRWETVKYVDPNDPEHKKVLEKKVHHERYRGEDQWRGEFFRSGSTDLYPFLFDKYLRPRSSYIRWLTCDYFVRFRYGRSRRTKTSSPHGGHS